ncbi:MAG: hypothetical protein HY696_03375 [Deltaproteobacteria bacterium]|nr:hypothetical protein [Deltaproteobacteria bacterium]
MSALNDNLLTTEWPSTVVRAAGDGAFLLLEPVEETDPWRDAVSLGVVSFVGATAGKVVVAGTARVAREAAVNLLGRDLPNDDTFDTAAMAALADLLAGALLTQWQGSDAVWELGMAQGFVETPERFAELIGTAPAWLGHFRTDEGQRFEVVVLSEG